MRCKIMKSKLKNNNKNQKLKDNFFTSELESIETGNEIPAAE